MGRTPQLAHTVTLTVPDGAGGLGDVTITDIVMMKNGTDDRRCEWVWCQ